jgi:hypothetical protein
MLTTHHKDDFANYGGGFYWFHGVVEDVSDPLQLGRVRVRCLGFHTDDRGLLPTSGLPWALCMLPITSPSMAGVGQSATGILPGSWVIGFFRDGPSAQDPIVMGSIASKIAALPDKTKGFSDPSGANPTRTGADIPTEAISGTAAAKATYKQTLDLDYIAPTYPNNQVIKTRSGHVIEYDDTTSKERVSLMHKTGAFIEIDPSGNINVCGSTLNTNGTTVNVRGSSYINLIAPKIYQNIRTGTTGTLAESATTTISFSPDLPSTDYTVVAASGNTGANHPMPGISNKKVSSFDMTISAGDAGVYQWIAITNTNNIG